MARSRINFWPNPGCVLYNPLMSRLEFLVIINVCWAANQYIRMISERSCDTTDWSNDAENSALHHSNKYNFKFVLKQKTTFLIVRIFHNFIVFIYFWSNKCSLSENKTLLSKTWINLTVPKLCTVIYCTFQFHFMYRFCITCPRPGLLILKG